MAHAYGLSEMPLKLTPSRAVEPLGMCMKCKCFSSRPIRKTLRRTFYYETSRRSLLFVQHSMATSAEQVLSGRSGRGKRGIAKTFAVSRGFAAYPWAKPGADLGAR